jgi:hypothetical protein
MREASHSRRKFLGGAALAAGLGALPFRDALALQAGEPSRTARGAALQRAAHQLLETPHVFDDPLALRIFGAEGVRWLGQNLDLYRTNGSRAMRAWFDGTSRRPTPILDG